MTNIPYSRLNKNDHENISFVANVFTVIAPNLNPLSLDMKVQNQKDQKMVDILWEKRAPNTFYKHICQKGKLTFSNGLYATFYKKE